MADKLSVKERSRLMAKIGQKNTRPELEVRSILHKMGYRFSLHRRDLPGTPDIVLSKYGIAVFVHGCFWHGHGCMKGRMPKSRIEYWGPKIEENRKRDVRKCRQLRAAGWKVLCIRECDLKNKTKLLKKLSKHLPDKQSHKSIHQDTSDVGNGKIGSEAVFDAK